MFSSIAPSILIAIGGIADYIGENCEKHNILYFGGDDKGERGKGGVPEAAIAFFIVIFFMGLFAL